MLKRLFGFGRKPALVKGTSKLPDGHAKKVDIGDTLAGTGNEIVFCRLEGTLYALDAVCPHEGGRLMSGPLEEGKYAHCPLHRYNFDPKTGKVVGDLCRPAKVYKVRESDGDAEIWL